MTELQPALAALSVLQPQLVDLPDEQLNALLEGAAREYGSDRKLGATHVSVAKTREAADEAWRAAGIEADDEEAKDAALASVAGTPVPRGQGGGIVMKLGKTYLEELEIRRK